MTRYFRDDDWGNFGLAYVAIEPGCSKCKPYNREGKLTPNDVADDWDLKWLLETVDLKVMREITESEAKALINPQDRASTAERDRLKLELFGELVALLKEVRMCDRVAPDLYHRIDDVLCKAAKEFSP